MAWPMCHIYNVVFIWGNNWVIEFTYIAVEINYFYYFETFTMHTKVGLKRINYTHEIRFFLCSNEKHTQTQNVIRFINKNHIENKVLSIHAKFF